MYETGFKDFFEIDMFDKKTVLTAGGYDVHPLANIVPLSEDFDRLAKSINDDGLNLPIVMYDGKIIDGRRRAIACKSIGKTPRIDDIFDPLKPLTEAELYKKVLAYNNRRNLLKAQEAMVAAYQTQANRHIDLGYKQADMFAKEVFNISPTTYKKARYVLKHDKKTAANIFETGYGFFVGDKPETLSRAFDRLKNVENEIQNTFKESSLPSDTILEDKVVELEAELKELKFEAEECKRNSILLDALTKEVKKLVSPDIWKEAIEKVDNQLYNEVSEDTCDSEEDFKEPSDEAKRAFR